MDHRAIRAPNPSYNLERGSIIPPHGPPLISHPHDNPGQYTRRRASWCRAEDERLAHLVRLEEAYSSTNTPVKMWSRIAAQLTGRTGKECRERWLHQLKPGIRRGSWTDKEEHILQMAHAELGNKWVSIAQRLPGRTDNCVKNHWNSMLRTRKRQEAALRSSYAAETLAVPAQVPGGIIPGRIMPGGGMPCGSILGQISADLARHASTTGEEKKIGNPGAACYEAMYNQNTAMYQSLGRALVELPGLTSPITQQRNAKLQIANLVVPAKTGPTYNHHYHVTAGVGEKRPVSPLNYDSVSKRRSVLYPSAQLNLGSRRVPMNRTLNSLTFPDSGGPRTMERTSRSWKKFVTALRGLIQEYGNVDENFVRKLSLLGEDSEAVARKIYGMEDKDLEPVELAEEMEGRKAGWEGKIGEIPSGLSEDGKMII